jgi:lipopolysaccharide transport system permease protein
LKQPYWDTILTPQRPFFHLNLGELWSSFDLLLLFTKRDIAQLYKQTILGPLWFFLQPLMMTLVFTVVFGNIAGISTDGIPGILFYLSALTFWNFFAEVLNKTSTTFRDNQSIFGKIYFARLIVPLSIVLNNSIKFGIQFFLFLIFYFYYLYAGAADIHPNLHALLFPLLVMLAAGQGLGFGLIITSMTTKYRDLTFLVTFGVQLLMYLSPVVYPLSEVPEDYRIFAVLNPITSVIETFKYGFLGKATFSWLHLGYSVLSTGVLLLFGMLVFNRTEKNFMDVI